MSSSALAFKPADDKLERNQQKVLSLTDYVGKTENFKGLSVEPYAPVAGAVIRGLHVTQDSEISAEVRQFLYQRLLRYGFLAFEPGTVSGDDFGHLVKLFGQAEYSGTPFTPPPVENPEVNTIDSAIKKTRMNFIWHIDQGFRAVLPRFTALFAKTVPPVGGDTLFSNAVAAYELLDPKFAAYLDTLVAVHDINAQGYLSLAYQNPEEHERQRQKYPPIEVPVIRVHEETGRKQIYVNELYTQRILGLSRTASDALLAILFEQIKLPEVEARVAWHEGAAVIWDNRIVQHKGVGDYGDGRRVLHRAIIA
ncbi:taurine dioxygenase [Betaproteobacteria bacterium]|nr:taurine dioxygenase [Betaproteobacteria bacterium]GHU01121.1 taurine dioxygenase [Betaproteobacteria bacterium]GHU17961.1 taurine dioxygenase [Betaproteobacteria bacterium]GHU30291.1 taurine dioxygenase [Betaproteobacteria bacterium]